MAIHKIHKKARVEVQFNTEKGRRWFLGSMTHYNTKTSQHYVVFDDGEKKWMRVLINGKLAFDCRVPH
jgi:hypothetical protein